MGSGFGGLLYKLTLRVVVYSVEALTVVVRTWTETNLILHLPSYTGVSSPSDSVQEYSISKPCSLPIYRNTETGHFMHTILARTEYSNYSESKDKQSVMNSIIKQLSTRRGRGFMQKAAGSTFPLASTSSVNSRSFFHPF